MRFLKTSLIFLASFLFLVTFLAGDDAKIIGIEIPSQWGASWRFPTNSIDNAGNRGAGVKDFRNLHSLKDGDVLVIGAHSNPDIFGAGTRKVNWTDFWSHFRVENPPKLGAVVLAGCMSGVTDTDLERIRSAFGAGVVFSPRGTYGLPHLISTESILAGLKYGTNLENIFQQVRNTHFIKTAPDVRMSWNLNQLNSNRQTYVPDNSGITFPNLGSNISTANYVIWINKFGSGGRLHTGTASSYKADKKYTNEWLAGTSQELLKKKLLFGGRKFDSKQKANEFICGHVGNPRRIKILGWGMVDVADFQGKRHYINGLGCSIP